MRENGEIQNFASAVASLGFYLYSIYILFHYVNMTALADSDWEHICFVLNVFCFVLKKKKKKRNWELIIQYFVTHDIVRILLSCF